MVDLSVATIDCNKKLPTLGLMIDLELQKAQTSAMDFSEAEDDIIGSDHDLDDSGDAVLDLEAAEEVETEDEYANLRVSVRS